MQELTLTGATLRSDGTEALLLADPVLTSGGANTQTHSHNHSHGHNHSKPCCNNHAGAHAQPSALALKKSATELVEESTDAQVYATVQQVVRMGSLDLVRQVIDTWREHRRKQAQAQSSSKDGSSNANSSNSNSNSSKDSDATIDALLQSYDDNGHTLLHWAAKRTDAVELVQYFLAVPYDPKMQQMQPSNSTHDASSNNNDDSTDIVAACPTPVHRPCRDDTRMSALHWACTQESALSVLKALLHVQPVPTTKPTNTTASATNTTSYKSSLLELRDGTGCTPLLIAAQHGHVDTVAYLIQQGAHVAALDASRDSATHWAAYKGSERVLGLLSYFDAAPLTHVDAYGQTPLHLAALRGHVETVRYILRSVGLPSKRQLSSPNHHNRNASGVERTRQRAAAQRQVKELLHLKDTNGRTPLALAIHKDKPAVAAVLRAANQTKQTFSWTSVQELCSGRTCKVWLGLPEVDDMDESPKFPLYYVFLVIASHILFYISVYFPIFRPGTGVLWDCMFQHSVAMLTCVLTVYCLYHCNQTNPGRLDDTAPPEYNVANWRRLYEQTLESYASVDVDQTSLHKVALCHTCHIARPARSKHDRFARACILQFDHHCPFVGTSVGLYNYKWFFGFLVGMTIYLLNFWLLFYYQYKRDTHLSNATIAIALVIGLHIFFPLGMLIYHSQLVYVNLTTNEHMNTARYDYFWEMHGSTRRFYNPWDKGWWGNFLDRLSPSAQSYLLPDQDATLERLLMHDVHGQQQHQQHHRHDGHNVV